MPLRGVITGKSDTPFVWTFGTCKYADPHSLVGLPHLQVAANTIDAAQARVYVDLRGFTEQRATIGQR